METFSPDKEHFDKMLLKELAWKLDREVWAHVPNPSPSEEWTTSKAREETRRLIAEYIGDYDKLRSDKEELLQALKELNTHRRLGFNTHIVLEKLISKHEAKKDF